MNREQKWAFGVLLALSVVLNVAFGAEHIWIVTRPSPPAIDAVTCIIKMAKP